MTTPSPLSTAEYHALLRRDLDAFIERAFYELNPQSTFLPGQYIELLAATLDKCRKGETKRLIINLPPRTLKSHAASVAFPAWLLGHDPTIQIICASYGQDLADKHARDCRTLMNSDFYRRLFPAATLSDAKLAVNDFMTVAQGFRMSTSVGGVLTGRGADVIILDDILKPEDALSETRRKAANEWYFSTLLSRLNSKEHGVIIIVMQRLHQEDLVGEVTDREPWEVLSLPAIAIDDEEYLYENIFGEKSFERKAGEALHAERDSVETYRKIREAVGEYNFQSQYQQSPMSREGGLVKKSWLKFYEPGQFPSDFSWTLQSWDTACKIRDTNDYSVCTTWKLIGRNYYLLDVFRERLTYPELKRRAIELFKKFQPFKVVIEDQASGTALIQEITTEGVYCAEAYKPAPGSDKQVRFAAHSIKFENGRVFLPNQALWLDEYIREITGFPGSKHDDQVDSTSQALESLEPYARSLAVFEGLERLCSRRYPIEYGG
ncbi:MAG: phage terminase large subunit [Terracidiphilus sp.]|jgi:predicted phage terminase large subunit-like protein